MASGVFSRGIGLAVMAGPSVAEPRTARAMPPTTSVTEVAMTNPFTGHTVPCGKISRATSSRT
ncbi:hypothetical protein [Cryobacterium sp.]|uniref:hypothetical protein n=1 Tax=Cryobacterium sp. TaxID=1926290 RepID=UPI002629FDF5|nr:hypothetical protein [Cryobacterium sp.]